MFSAIVFLRVRADRLGDLDRSLRVRAASMAALVERDHGTWATDLGGQGDKVTLAGAPDVWEVRVASDDRVLARDPPAGPSLFDLPQRGDGAETHPIDGRETRVWRGSFVVRSDDAPNEDEEAAPPGVSGKPAVVRIAVAENLEPLAADMRSLLGLLVAAGGALAACALFLGVLLSRQIVGPLERMARRAEDVRSASAEAPLPRDGTGDEVDRLAATLNATFSRLHDSWSRQARFTADASHELRTPLSVIRSQSEVALRRARSPEEYQSSLAAVVESAGRMEETLEGLLMMARADTRGTPGSKEMVDLRAAALDAIGSVTGTAKGVDVRLEAQDEPRIAGDARQIEILFRNLLSNAVRHTPAPGEVVIALSKQADGGVVVEVRDTGEGIPADALPHVFERFYRVDEARNRDRGGSGLGLSIVRAIAEQHGGTVEASSTVGKGTVVTVRLPASA